MYKIMIADDEGIAIEGLRFIIEKNFGGHCVIECAKTGREVIELAETFRPDIAFMDIHMPGINGIDAIKEIKKTQPGIRFIILSAYDKFSYAKTAIELGVLKYLNKPIDQKQIVLVLEEAMAEIDKKRAERSEDLRIREKLETVVPMLESAFVYEMIFKNSEHSEEETFKELLGIEEMYGYVIVLEFGENVINDKMTNVTGTSVILQNNYQGIREGIIAHVSAAVVCSPLANKIVVFVPENHAKHEYRERMLSVNNARSMAEKLANQYNVAIRIGIGDIKDIKNMKESYLSAVNALRLTERKIAHAHDVSASVAYEEDYPINTEKNIFEYVKRGDRNNSVFEAGLFYDWMIKKSGGDENDIRLKVLEFVLHSERIAYEQTGMNYVFKSRTEYLPSVNKLNTDNGLKEWFIEKIGQAAGKVANTKTDKKGNVIGKALEYIKDNYNKNISLDDVSMEIDVTPYYFSRLFKEEMDINFVEYVNQLRIDKAKELLTAHRDMSMKEICLEVGYSDPNYFSRQFKKYAGISPTEFREGMNANEN